MRKHLYTDTGIAEIPSFYHGLLSCCLFCFVFLRSRKVKWYTKVQAREFELGPPISTAHILNLSSTLSSLKARRSKVIPQVFVGWPFGVVPEKVTLKPSRTQLAETGLAQVSSSPKIHSHSTNIKGRGLEMLTEQQISQPTSVFWLLVIISNHQLSYPSPLESVRKYLPPPEPCPPRPQLCHTPKGRLKSHRLSAII